MVDFATREHNIFLTNRPSYEYVCKPLAGISDHEIVYVTSAVDIELQKPRLFPVESIVYVVYLAVILIWRFGEFLLVRQI